MLIFLGGGDPEISESGQELTRQEAGNDIYSLGRGTLMVFPLPSPFPLSFT
jgi:hypothetical protein